MSAYARARSAVICIALAVVIGAVLGAMLVAGYVPMRLHGPMGERIFTLCFGFGNGLIIAVGLRIVLDER